MKCPSCGYENEPSALCCNLCTKILPKEKSPAPAGPSVFIGHAESAVENHKPMGLDLDFSLASIFTLDVFLDEMWGTKGYSPDREKWAPDDGQWAVILSIGSYFGEVMRRAFGGRWIEDPKSRENPLYTQLALGTSAVVFPFGRLWKRLKNGSGDGLEAMLLGVRRTMPAKSNAAAEAMDYARQGDSFAEVKRDDLARRFYDRALKLDPKCDRAIQGRSKALKPPEQKPAPKPAPKVEPPPPPRAEPPNPPLDFTADTRRAEVWISKFNMKADYTPSSLPAVEVLARVLTKEEKTETFIRMFGGYVGEVFRRVLGASWEPDPLGERLESKIVFPDRRFVYPFRLVRDALQLGTQGEITSVFDRYRAAPPDPKEAADWVRQGDGLRNLGRPDLARAYYEKALAIDPRNAKASAGMNAPAPPAAVGADEVQKLIDECVRPTPEAARRCLEEGLQLARKGQMPQALELFNRAADIDPNLVDAWLERGVLLATAGRLDDALKSFDQALRVEPRNAKTWRFKATAVGRMGRLADAVEMFRTSLEIDPSNPAGWKEIGFCLSELGRHEEALRNYDKAVALDPAYAEAWALKGDSERRLGRKSEAVQSFQKFIRQAPPSMARQVDWARKQIAALEAPSAG